MDRSRITSYYNMSTTNNNENNAAGESYPYNGRVLLAAVILLSVVIFFVILLHIYARWFLRRRHTGLARVVSEPLRTLGSFPIFYDDQVAFFSKGLESKYIASLPMFVVDANYKEGDCVVCLSLMGEGEVGRRLPKCRHVFHVGCIDMWLMSNSTCPICRAQVNGAEEKGVVVVGDAAAVVVEVVEEEVVVVVGDEEVNNVVVELPLDSTRIVVKGDVSFPTSLSSSLSTTTATNTSTGSCSSSSSLKRVLSKSRSENRVFPSALVN